MGSLCEGEKPKRLSIANFQLPIAGLDRSRNFFLYRRKVTICASLRGEKVTFDKC